VRGTQLGGYLVEPLLRRLHHQFDGGERVDPGAADVAGHRHGRRQDVGEHHRGRALLGALQRKLDGGALGGERAGFKVVGDEPAWTHGGTSSSAGRSARARAARPTDADSVAEPGGLADRTEAAVAFGPTTTVRRVVRSLEARRTPAGLPRRPTWEDTMPTTTTTETPAVYRHFGVDSDDGGFAALWRDARKRLLGLARRLTGSTADAEDTPAGRVLRRVARARGVRRGSAPGHVTAPNHGGRGPDAPASPSTTSVGAAGRAA